MDTNQTQELFCRGCGEPFQNGAICCSLCGLQLNEEPDTIEIGLVEKVKVEIEEKNDQLLIGANAAYGTKDWSEFKERMGKLKPTLEPSNPVGENNGLEQLMVLFQNIVTNPDQKFTLLDDNPDRLTLATISNKDGVINASFSVCPWEEEAFDNNRERRLCQLLAGYEAPTSEWFSRNVKSKIDPKTQLVHTSVYRNASHSQTIDKLIKQAYPNTAIEKLVYLSDQSFKDLINRLCVTAPLKEEIKVLSAQIGQNGTVTYNEVLVFPKDQFIEQDNEVTISVKSNTVINKTSKLIFFKGKWASEQTMYEYDLEVEPGETRKCSLKLTNRGLDGITVDSNKVKAVSERRPEMPKTVDVSRRRVEVFLILDTIVYNEETFIDRKKIVEDLIDEIGQYDQQIDFTFHLYSYSCDFVPAYSRPSNWPNEYTEFSGNLENTKKTLKSLKMSKANAHVFPSRLELVFEEIEKYKFDKDNTYCMFFIGNRPARPKENLPMDYGASIDWRIYWEKIQSRFYCIQVIHCDSFDWSKNSLSVYNENYYNSFWNTISPHNRILKWSKQEICPIIENHLIEIMGLDIELLFPLINEVKGW